MVTQLPGHAEGSTVVHGEIGTCNVAKELEASSTDDVREQVLDNIQTAIYMFAKSAQYVQILLHRRKKTSRIPHGTSNFPSADVVRYSCRRISTYSPS